MGWFKKQAPIEQWQFFVIDDKRKGYRINDQCQPLWETPKGIPKYFLGTQTEAYAKASEIYEKWKEVFGVYPAEIMAQEYYHIPDKDDVIL
jgi:hypothetical protein